MPNEKLMVIEGMTCEHCSKTVAEALTAAGAEKVEVDWRQGKASLDTRGVSDEQLTAAVEEGGYKVVSLKPARLPDRGFDAVVGEKRHDYDLVIVGSGSAAFAAAITAAEQGARVAMIESNTIGGTCVNVGCIPSKAMLAPAEAYYRAGHHSFPGIRTRAEGFDLAALVDSKQDLVDQLRQEKYIDLARDYGFSICHGRAEFVDAQTVECGGDRITAAKFIIATGASPSVPEVDGLKDAGYLTSTTALELREPPQELIVIGASSIGLELGQLFLHLGSKVTILQRSDRIASREEPEASAAIAAVFEEQGATILTGVALKRVRREGSRRIVTFERNGREEEIAGDEILVSTGRRPNTAGLGLEKAGVEVTKSGAVRVDDALRTTNPNIWAIGDVSGNPQFVYAAAYEGNMAARNALEGADLKVDFSAMPRIIFTSPVIAAAGLTDEQATQQGIECECRVLPMEYVPRALVNRDTRGFVKIVAEVGTGRILGATVVAEGAGDVIQAAIFAIQFGLTTEQVAQTWAPYLTFAEGFKLAAQTFTRDVSKLSCCAA
ncbi:MAG: mercury(II) reductase [Candidatus Dormibacteria bacterium]